MINGICREEDSMQPDKPNVLVLQAVRRSDHRIVSWYRRDGIDHLLPAVQDDTGQETPLDMRVQWNERDFFARVYANPAPTKADRYAPIKRLLLEMPTDIGWRPLDLQQALANKGVCIAYRALTRDLQKIGAIRISRGRYTYAPTAEEIELARLFVNSAEGGETK